MEQLDLDLRASFGAAVRESREELGLSQEELAKSVGFKGRATVSQIERNRGGATLPRALRLIDFLGVDVSLIVGAHIE